MQGALLAAALRQRYGNQPSIGRSHVPVHGSCAVRVISIGIEHRPPQGRRCERGEAHEDGLLGGRFEPQGKDPAVPLLQIEIAGRLLPAQLRQLLREAVAERQPREISARPLIFQARPLAHRRGGRSLEPLVIVHDHYSVIDVSRRLARRRHGRQHRAQGEPRQKDEEEHGLAHPASGSADRLSHAGKVSSVPSGGKAFGFFRIEDAI